MPGSGSTFCKIFTYPADHGRKPFEQVVNGDIEDHRHSQEQPCQEQYHSSPRAKAVNERLFKESTDEPTSGTIECSPVRHCGCLDNYVQDYKQPQEKQNEPSRALE